MTVDRETNGKVIGILELGGPPKAMRLEPGGHGTYSTMMMDALDMAMDRLGWGISAEDGPVQVQGYICRRVCDEEDVFLLPEDIHISASGQRFICGREITDCLMQSKRWAKYDVGLPANDNVRECDAWVVTGSVHGVYEELPWMLHLQRFLRKCLQEEVPVLGICFGHQILAAAMGGKVEKASCGFVLGLDHYNVHLPKMLSSHSRLQVTLVATHQDQVVEVPPMARPFMRSERCPNAGLIYVGREHRATVSVNGEHVPTPGNIIAISIQPHPEFSVSYVRDEAKVLEAVLGKEKTGVLLSCLEKDVSGLPPGWDDPVVSMMWACEMMLGKWLS
jgi:GMP synthase-like glutamine amidotransferase